MHTKDVDPIQTQREVWLRAKIQKTEREKEYEEGVRRLASAVERASEREAAEESKLDALIAEAKTRFDEYKSLPQLMTNAEEAALVEQGSVFNQAPAEDWNAGGAAISPGAVYYEPQEPAPGAEPN